MLAIQIAVDLYPGTMSWVPAHMIAVGGRVALEARTLEGFELVTTDGTPAGTTYFNLRPGFNPRNHAPYSSGMQASAAGS